MNHDRFIRSARRRYLVVACAALATAGAATAALAGSTSASGTSVHTIHLVGHETQNKFLSQGGFAGTLTSVSSATPPLTISTLDLQLQGGQITVQGFVDTSKSPSVTAVTGGTGIYRGARGEFSFTEPARSVLDITITLLPSGQR